MAATSAIAQTLTTKPNILFILADDLGYGDLGCYGQKLIATPNIDKLASEGIRFTQFYCGSTVCAPSRCSLMTGKHTGHARIRGNARVDLLPEDVTIAEVLKDAGYQTGLVGKWGLGTAGRSGIPNRQGFDEFYGVLDQKHAHTQYPTQLWDNEDETFLDGNFGPERTDYAQEVYHKTSSAVSREKQDQPVLPLSLLHDTTRQQRVNQAEREWHGDPRRSSVFRQILAETGSGISQGLSAALDRDVGSGCLRSLVNSVSIRTRS